MKILNQIEKYVILTTVFLYPIFILTVFTNIFETPKLFLLTFATALIVLVKIFKLYIEKSYEYNSTKYDISIVSIAVVYLISTIFSIVNKVDALFLPGTTGFIVLSTILFLIINQFSEKLKQHILTTLLVSGFILAVIQIADYFGITKIIPFLPEVFKLSIFNLFGNAFSLILFLVCLLPLLISKIFEKNDLSEKILSGLVAIVYSISIISTIYLVLPGKETSVKILNYNYGWSISIDSLKVNPLVGVGPTNFNYAFNKFRPIEFNNNDDWNLKYLQSSSFVLTMLTETGILGLIAIVYFLYLVIKNTKLTDPKSITVSLLTVGFMVLPLSTSLIFILFVLLSVSSTTKPSKIELPIASKFIQQTGIGISIALLTTFIYFSGRAFYSEYLFSRSIASLNSNEAIKAYDYVNKAVLNNPFVDRYHLFSAALNMALAERLAKKVDLTDEDRTNISKLIQQAIREGKASVAVAVYKSSNWESLFGTYQTIISFAKGADTFAIESINQAISLDPINPVLRIRLGSLYFALQKYDKAVDVLKLAVIAKPNYANAHYNLSLAYKETKQLEKAKEEMNIVLSLLGKESLEYEMAIKELQTIEELTKPVEKIEPSIKPELEILQNDEDVQI